MGIFGSEDTDQYEPYIADGAGSTVTAKRVGDIAQYLDDNEEVHHIIKSPQIEHGSGDADENQSTATKMGEAATVAFTGVRVVIKVPHYITGEQYALRYQRIQNVSYDISGVVGMRTFTLGTAGDTYKIGVHIAIDDEEVREVVDWVDKRVAETFEDETDSGSRSPRERLDELESLHDDGVVTDEEYERKREEILDEL